MEFFRNSYKLTKYYQSIIQLKVTRVYLNLFLFVLLGGLQITTQVIYTYEGTELIIYVYIVLIGLIFIIKSISLQLSFYHHHRHENRIQVNEHQRLFRLSASLQSST